MTEDVEFTVGDLREALRLYNDDDPVIFGSGGGNTLTFYRVKNRGRSDQPLVQIEFNEVYAIDPVTR